MCLMQKCFFLTRQKNGFLIDMIDEVFERKEENGLEPKKRRRRKWV